MPVAVAGTPLDGKEVAQLVSGFYHSCALSSDNVLACWGRNGFGELGNGGSTNSTVPVAVQTAGTPLDGKTIASISAGDYHTCALATDGTLACWGYDNFGQVGKGSAGNASVPTAVVTAGTPLAGRTVTQVAAGGYHTCALDDLGAAACWGGGASGVLGNGTNGSSTVPVAVTTAGTPLAGKVLVQIDGGRSSSCAVAADGTTACWGANTAGQLGDGTNAGSNVPVGVATAGTALDGKTVKLVGLFFEGACALATDGTVSCWGDNSVAQLGNGTFANSNVPTALAVAGTPLDGKTPAEMSIGAGHGCVLTTDEVLSCWGYNASGQLGNDSTIDSPVPVSGPNSLPVAFGQTVVASRGVGEHVVLTGFDPDGDGLAFDVVSGPSKGVLDCNGAFGEDCVYTGGPGQLGADSFTFTVTDDDGTSAAATVSITITNEAPEADAAAVSVPRGVVAPIVLTGSDPNGDPLTFTVVDEPAKGSLSCVEEACEYEADPGEVGADAFTFTVSDGEFVSAPATVAVTITNQAPVADARSITVPRQVATAVPLSGSDPNGDALVFSVVGQPSKGTVDCTGPDGSACTYTSDPGETGTDAFTYVADDGDLQSAPTLVMITLVGTAPSALAQSVSAPRGVATPITLTGSDPEGDGLAFDLVDQPAKGSLSCGGADGSSCSYTAGVGQTGSDEFTFTVTDADGTSAPATVTITITNQAPSASDQVISAAMPTVATPITLAGADPNGDPLTYEVVTPPTKGTLTCDAAGSCTYTATAGATGADSFTFRTLDGFGGISAEGTVVVSIDPDAPGVYVGGTHRLEPHTVGSPYKGSGTPLLLSQPASTDLTVWYWVSSGTATRGVDFGTWGTEAKPRSATLKAGKTWTTIAVPFVGDDLVEGDETFQVHLSSVTGGPAYLGNTAATNTIIDEDSVTRPDPATPVLSVSSVTQHEGNDLSPIGARVQARISLSAPLAAPLTLRWSTVDGTAVAGTDYVAKTNVPVTFKPGATEAVVDLRILSNRIIDGDRSFTIELSSITGPDIALHASTATITILDDDGTPSTPIIETPTSALIAAGEHHTCAVIAGALSCWGRNQFGQLGDGGTTDSSVPVAVAVAGTPLAGKTITQVAAGDFHSCALASDGTAACWGRNFVGQLGDGATTDSLVPVAIAVAGTPLAGKTITQVAAGGFHSCAAASDGTAACWGWNIVGQLGDGGTTSSWVPVAVAVAGTPLAGKAITQVTAGYGHSCALAFDGTAACWGVGGAGQLGDGGTTNSSVPVAVATAGTPLAGKTVTQVTAGADRSCALAADGTAACWGSNVDGQLGDGGTTNSSVPVAVATAGTPLAGKTIIQVTTRFRHSCALAADGTAACWGLNGDGQLGDGGTTGSWVPVAVEVAGTPLAGRTIVQVAVGNFHSCALASDGTAACWGANPWGQLGDGGTTGSSVPVAVTVAP